MLEWISNKKSPILKSMMKISNKLKTPARVFDVFLKENKSSLDLESATCAISSRSNALERLEMGRKVTKIGDPNEL